MSERITETADSTNSHNSPRKPSFISVSVSSDIRHQPPCPPVGRGDGLGSLGACGGALGAPGVSWVPGVRDVSGPDAACFGGGAEACAPRWTRIVVLPRTTVEPS